MSFLRRFLLLIVLVVGLEQVVCSDFGRSILQDAAAPVADTTEDVAEAETVDAGSITAYQTASATDGSLVKLTYYNEYPWDIVQLNATLELNVSSSYATSAVNRPSGFNTSNELTWQPGTSRVNISVLLSTGQGNTVPSSLLVKVHTVDCSRISADNVYQRDPTKPALVGSNITETDKHLVLTITTDYLVNYDEVKSIVLYMNDGSGSDIACANMVPPFPDLPADWVATIERNFITQGFTFVQRTYYSQSFNKIRTDLHSYGSDRILITDYTANTSTVIHPGNTTYPHGYCEAGNFTRATWRAYNNQTGTIVDTAAYLGFTESGGPITYVTGPPVSVRGIPCEVWTQDFTLPIPMRRRSSNSSAPVFTAKWYFPVNEWLVAREDYHRLLKRVELNGTDFRGNAMEASFEYVNFRPYNFSGDLLNVCRLAPYGTNCNCTAAMVKSAFRLASTDDGDGVVIDTTDRIPNTRPCDGWFIPAQSGPYVLLTFIGFFAGILVAGLAWFLSDPSRFQRSGRHIRFVDDPAAVGRSEVEFAKQ